MQTRDVTDFVALNYDERFVQQLIAHQSRLRAFVRTLLPIKQDADDVLQEINLVLCRRSGDFVEGSNFERPLPTLSTNQGGLVESSSSLPDSVIGKDGMRLARDFENRANMRLSKLIFGQKVVSRYNACCC